MKKELNIGLVGYGFMGRTHSNAFLQAPRFFDLPYQPVLKAVCARSAERVKGFADNWGWQSIETDWRTMVERKDIDVIDIASPNNTHAEIAIAAAKAGKMVLCEKPLGRTAEEAKTMVDAVEAAGVANMVWYNYRRVPAVTMLKGLLDEDRFGRIFHYRSQFLQDWTISQDLPQGGEGLWRLDASVAGSGVTGDLLAHNIDMALWLNGPIVEVSAMTETFIKERKHSLTGEVSPVTIDDASAFLCRFANGSLAMFEATRYARGHKALFTLEINGERASAMWDLHDLHRLEWFDYKDEGPLRGWKSIHITDGDHPYMKNWWVPGLQIGYEHTFTHQVADFVTAIGEKKVASPTFRDGLATEYVTDAVLKSAKTKQWETVATMVLAIILALSITGCGPQRSTASSYAPVAAQLSPNRSYNLTIAGYNYSDSGISSFEVNGDGGGNLEVSTPTAGGGKSTCCVTVYAPLSAPQPVAIKWSRDIETWCEQTVFLKPPLPAKPEYFEAHFYKDGHVEVAVTEAASPPRLQLERDGPGNRYADMSINVNHDSKFSRCKLGYR